MKNVYYVQRLLAPIGETNPFSFGGGLRNGGLSQEGINVLKDIFSFDYMGSAEFEFGALPKAFEALQDNKTLIHFTMDKNDSPLYVICPEDTKEDLKLWLIDCEYLELKESLGFNRADVLGWIKTENERMCNEPFMFFKDEEMFIKTIELFNSKLTD